MSFYNIFYSTISLKKIGKTCFNKFFNWQRKGSCKATQDEGNYDFATFAGSI